MIDYRAIGALVVQFLVIGITYIIVSKWTQFSSVKLGVLIMVFFLLLGDALPWISIWKVEFTFDPKWHHSRSGLFCLFLALIYRGFVYIFSDHFESVRSLRYYLEEKIWLNVGSLKIQLFYVCLGIALTLVLTQVHEIFYFGTLKFPDRGFPYDIRLRLGSPREYIHT